jgi:hypothetical protein
MERVCHKQQAAQAVKGTVFSGLTPTGKEQVPLSEDHCGTSTEPADSGMLYLQDLPTDSRCLLPGMTENFDHRSYEPFIFPAASLTQGGELLSGV